MPKDDLNLADLEVSYDDHADLILMGANETILVVSSLEEAAFVMGAVFTMLRANFAPIQGRKN